MTLAENTRWIGTMRRVLEYARTQGHCTPRTAYTIDADPLCPVWKVEVESFDDSWDVPPPKFWYVCPEGVMELYRNDSQRPWPWLPAEKQKEDAVIDYIKSFHLGVVFRLLNKDLLNKD